MKKSHHNWWVVGRCDGQDYLSDVGDRSLFSLFQMKAQSLQRGDGDWRERSRDFIEWKKQLRKRKRGQERETKREGMVDEGKDDSGG